MVQDSDNKRYTDEGNNFSLQIKKMLNSDEVSSKLKSSDPLDTDQSPKDSLKQRKTTTHWQRLNNDIQQSNISPPEKDRGSFKSSRSPQMNRTGFQMIEQLGDSSGQNTSETIKFTRDRIYS